MLFETIELKMLCQKLVENVVSRLLSLKFIPLKIHPFVRIIHSLQTICLISHFKRAPDLTNTNLSTFFNNFIFALFAYET